MTLTKLILIAASASGDVNLEIESFLTAKGCLDAQKAIIASAPYQNREVDVELVCVSEESYR